MKVKIVDAQNDPAKQANDIADLLEGGVSILIVNPVDSAAISTSVEAANKKASRLSPLTALLTKVRLLLSSLPITLKVAKWQLT